MWSNLLFGTSKFTRRLKRCTRPLEVEELECRDQPAVLIDNPLAPIVANPLDGAAGQFAAQAPQSSATNSVPPAALPPSVGNALIPPAIILIDLISPPQGAPLISGSPDLTLTERTNVLSSVPKSIRPFSQLGFLSGVSIPTQSLSEIGHGYLQSLRVIAESFSAPEIPDTEP